MSAQIRHECLRLENQLCFALYAASRAITKAYRKGLDPIDLTYPQYLVMAVLWEHGSIILSDMGKKLRLDSGTLSPILKRLETAGFVVRERRKEDEREVLLTATEKGLSLRDGAVDARDTVVRALDMSEIDILALRADVMSVIDRLEAFSEASTASARQDEVAA